MEIKIENKNINFNLTIKDKQINGVLGTNKEDLADIINLNNYKEETIWIDNKKQTEEELWNKKNKIRIIPQDIELIKYHYKVYESMYEEIKRNELDLLNPEKKVLDSLKIVGLDITYLTKNIHDLSSSEKKLLQIGMTLMSNPEVLILIEPFKEFDKKIAKRILSLFQVIVEQYNKTIVIISDDVNMLYNYTNHLIIEKNNKIIIEGNTKEVLENVNLLKKHKIDIPDIVEFTYLAKAKKAKIDYHRDIRDLMKDIYKHI